MNEFAAIQRARQFIKEAAIDSIPVDVEHLAFTVMARIKISHDMSDDESGYTISVGDKNIIAINGNHGKERQRFTILHEIAHIVLELPSCDHDPTATSSFVSHAKRPKEEVLCDVFAAECLLPHEFFKKDIGDEVSLAAVKNLAKKYEASLTATGSRFAVNCDLPCAFVLMEKGKVRYVSSSKALRELKGWIDIGIQIPIDSIAARLMREGQPTEDYDEIDKNIWFNNGVAGYGLLAEEAISIRELDQCLSLIWFDEGLRKTNGATDHSAYEDGDSPLLKELDGVLPWPSRSKRK